MATIAPISREELRDRLEQEPPLVLVDALSPMAYAHSRLPGAINLPPERVPELAARRIPDRSAEIVVYCASETCTSSLETAEALVALGFANVRHYAGGKKDWMRAGLRVERGADRRRG
jgi:rhodanese-related sulfurtransferase